jgi:hypothetical protein
MPRMVHTHPLPLLVDSCPNKVLDINHIVLATFMEQLSPLGVIPRNPSSTTKAFVDLKEELTREKVAR